MLELKNRLMIFKGAGLQQEPNLWSWKFRKKMVLELKTCIEGVPQAEVRLAVAPAEVGFMRR